MSHRHCALRARGPSPGEPKSDTRQAEVEKMGQENSGGVVRSFCLGLGRQ